MRTGPWATHFDPPSTDGLSTFWRRRMALLPSLQNRPAAPPWLAAVMIAGGLVAVGLPRIDSTYLPAAAADDAARPADGRIAVEFLPKLSNSEERILAALDVNTSLQFTESPIGEVVSFIKQKHGIEIQFDTKSLDDIGITIDSPVTININSVPLRSALGLMLGNLELKTIVTKDVLLITTPEVANAYVITRTYPVADLVNRDYSVLMDAITNIVSPTTWDVVGGVGTMSAVPASRAIVIAHTLEIHNEILTLLRSLRIARNISAGNPPASFEDWPQGTSPPVQLRGGMFGGRGGGDETGASAAPAPPAGQGMGTGSGTSSGKKGGGFF